MPFPRLVILDHDGGVDDYISLLLLLTFPDVEVLGVTVTPADCYLRPALSATRKLLALMGRDDVSVSGGNLRGQNAFPRQWRKECFACDALPILNERDLPLPELDPRPGHEHLAALLAQAPRPVTLLATGPLTQLAWALGQQPGLAQKIERLYWMGGALFVPGNVHDDPGVHDGSAEWNAYWDPVAAAAVWDSPVPITLFPLDVTDQVPVTVDFRQRLARQRRYPVSDLAGQLWAGVAHNPHYCFWDVLTTAALGSPDLVSTRPELCRIIADGNEAGRTLPVKTGGRTVDMAYAVDAAALHDYLLSQLAI
ncbi:MAG: nucleoside hydrolase [Caldilineales bacterium]|nr:nucleoside hydrolase [Caldilineales bacterium]